MRNGKAQEAKLPDLTLAVAAGTGAATASPAALPPIDTAAALPGSDGQDARIAATDPRASGLSERPWPWMAAAIGLALLWLLTLLWAGSEADARVWRRLQPARPLCRPW